MTLSRRALLAATAGVVGAPAFAQLPKPREEEPLILRAHRKGLVYGAVVPAASLTNPVFGDILADECGLIATQGEADWAALQPQPGRFDFSGFDRLANFAQRRNLLFRPRSLVRHSGLPDWMAEAVMPASVGRTLAEHVGPVVARYRGRVHSWDIIGEAIEPAHGRADGLRVTPWLKAMGPRYIDLAFRLARTIDRDALLAYSDAGLDAGTPEHAARRRAVVGLLEWLRGRGVPLDALSIDSRLDIEAPFDGPAFRDFVRDVAGMGLRVILTGLDVTAASRADWAAERLGRYVETALGEKAVIAVISAGLANQGGGHGLPLDGDLNRTAVWAALARAFDATPAR
jgi:endo-1,4-beta-xylanase